MRNFAQEYSSARPQNIIPWGIGPYMINDEFEVGHFEPCTSVSGPGTFTSGSFTDTYYDTCSGQPQPELLTGGGIACLPGGGTR